MPAPMMAIFLVGVLAAILVATLVAFGRGGFVFIFMLNRLADEMASMYSKPTRQGVLNGLELTKHHLKP